MKSKYDNETIVALYDLFGNYCFKIDEITKILNGKSIYSVIANKACNLLIKIKDANEEYDDEYGFGIELDENFFEKDEIEKDLIKNKKKIINLILSYKNELKDNDDLIKDIDIVLNIIEKLEELIDKYGNKFKEKDKKVNAYSIIKKIDKVDEKIVPDNLFYKVQEKLNKENPYKVEIIKKGYGSSNIHAKNIERQLNELYLNGYELVNANIIYDNNLLAILKKRDNK